MAEGSSPFVACGFASGSAMQSRKRRSMPVLRGFPVSFKAVRLNSLTYPVEPAERVELEKAGIELTAVEGQQPGDILDAATDCDALLVVSSRLPGQVIERLNRCRVSSRLGAGTDRPDIATATRRGLVVAKG